FSVHASSFHLPSAAVSAALDALRGTMIWPGSPGRSCPPTLSHFNHNRVMHAAGAPWKCTSTYTIPVGQFDTGLIAFARAARSPSPCTTRTCAGLAPRSGGRGPTPWRADASAFTVHSTVAVASALCVETEQLKE